jgi:hypothetical protein
VFFAGWNIDPSGVLYAANQNTTPLPCFASQIKQQTEFSTLVNTPTPVDVEFGSLA